MANKKPTKHRVDYRGRVLYYDVIFVEHHGYVGRVIEHEQLADGETAGKFTLTEYAYSDPVSAVNGAWQSMNEMCGIKNDWDPRRKRKR